MLTVAGGTAPQRNQGAICKVLTDGGGHLFTEFVAIGCEEQHGTVSLVHNADVITLGIALQLIKNQFTEAYTALTEEEQALVDNAFKERVG